MTEIKTKTLEHIKIEPGDVLVYRCGYALSEEEASNIRAALDRVGALDGCTLIFLDQGASLDVVRRGDAEAGLDLASGPDRSVEATRDASGKWHGRGVGE